MKKRYGDTDTRLTLTDKAQRAYDSISPVDIYEITDWDDDGYEVVTYSVNICGEKRDGLTEAEVNELLEEYAEPLTVRDDMKENGGFLDRCGCFYSESENAYIIDAPGDVSIYKPDEDEWITGTDVDLERFARAAVKDYNSFSGCSDLALIVNNLPRKDCRDCPCFGYCEAMDAEIN